MVEGEGGGDARETDDVAGVARAAEDAEGVEAPDGELDEEVDPRADPDATADPPLEVAELAAACVRFVASRYQAPLDFTPDTLSLLDHWLRDARAEVTARPEAAVIVQSAAGAYLGEVVRRQFGARWVSGGEPQEWRLCLSTVYCAFNPLGMAREALLLEPAEAWHAHLELDAGERDAVEARLEALPEAEDEEYYAPSTRFDILWIVVDALRASMRARGLDDVRFSPDDYPLA
jgi:hypothetical protein